MEVGYLAGELPSRSVLDHWYLRSRQTSCLAFCSVSVLLHFLITTFIGMNDLMVASACSDIVL